MLPAFALSLLLAAASPTPRPGEPIYTEVHEHTLVGELSVLPDPARHPAVIVLDEAGVPQTGTLTNEGYATLMLAYYGVPPLPRTLDRVPVETVSRAVDYLRALPEVDPNRIGVVGMSSGADLALLAAIHDPRIKSVVLLSPSAYVWFSPTFDGETARSQWTADNVGLPFLAPDQRVLANLAQAYQSHGTFAFRDLYDASLAVAPPGEVAQATIPAEKFAGPILCVAGDDDRQWDSVGACKTLAARRTAAHRDGADQTAIEQGAGHVFVLSSHPLPDVVPAGGELKLRLGGTPEANARGAADAWGRMLTFLGKTL